VRRLQTVLVSLCLSVACMLPARAQDKPKAPSMKKPEHASLPPTRLRKYYDREHDATYLNVDMSLLNCAVPPPACAREVKLTVQLIYKGKTTADLKTAYMFLESATPQGQPARLDAVKQIEIKADAYQYLYARTDYQTDSTTLTDAPPGTPPWQKEIIAFTLPLDDLPQLADAGRLELNLGAEHFTVTSVQLTNLRHALSAGAESHKRLVGVDEVVTCESLGAASSGIGE
jgi:hypothetical protein